jgi:maleate isomerase
VYRDDGWDVQWRLGVLTPHADVGPESELRAMAPREVGIHAARVPFGAMRTGGVMDPTVPLAPVRAFAEPPHVDDAVEQLAAAPLNALAFGFTSSAYVIGRAGESAMVERLAERAHGIPVVAASEAGLQALSAFDAERIALFLPPWFDHELTALGRDYYEGAGLEVLFSASCDLPSDQARIEPAAVYEFVKEHVPAAADAVVIGGNGFRTVGVIEALEGAIERPVLTANQVLLWASLRAARATTKVTGYGRLFDS